VLIQNAFFQSCDRYIEYFSIAPHKVIALPTLESKSQQIWYENILFIKKSFNTRISYNFILLQNNLFIPESFNTNISHQLYVYRIPFVNPQHYNTNSKGDFELQNHF
jgi:hypothetical protein